MKIILTSLLLITFCVAHAQTDTTKVVTTDSAVYFNPEIPAMYPGGIQAWYRYLQKNLRSLITPSVTIYKDKLLHDLL